MQAINYTQMIGLLVESIKDLTKQNKILSDKKYCDVIADFTNKSKLINSNFKNDLPLLC